MTRYQLVLRDPAGEDHVVLFDDSEAAEDNFAFCGQSLREGALIEVADGAMYIIVEQAEENGFTRFICEPL